jgi:cation:H+ antiporter
MLLGGASEAAQHDIPPSLSIAVLAFVAVLPEYAIDLLFAWRAADDPEQARFAIANMTGGNRLLLGVGWSAVLLAYIARNKFVLGHPSRVLELINLIVSAVLLLIFGTYLYRAARQPVETPEIGGPAEMVTQLPRWRRRVVIIGLFAFSAGVIVASAEPFADGLIALGESIGVDEFLLVQWLAPLASESPEFLAAMYLVWRGAARYGMTALISSKVNQFTLLIASLPIAFSISGGTLDGLPMDGRQQGEVLLTAAQSLFGIMLVLDKRMSLGAGVILLSLFLAQFALTDSTVRLGFAVVYLVLAGGLLLRRYRLIPDVVREAFGGHPLTEPEDASTPTADRSR